MRDVFNALLKYIIAGLKIPLNAAQVPEFFTQATGRWFYSFIFFPQVSAPHTSHLENSWLSPIRRKWRLTFSATGGHIYYEWRGGEVDPPPAAVGHEYTTANESGHSDTALYDSSIWYWCTLKCKQAQKAGGMQCCPHHLPICCWGGKVAY